MKPGADPHSPPMTLCFLDESGVVAQDRYFAVGVLSIQHSSIVSREVRKLRERRTWFDEFHFSGVSSQSLAIHAALIDALAADDSWNFRLCLADRHELDVAAVLGSRFLAYERIAAQCLHGVFDGAGQAVVVADEYVTPDSIDFENDVRRVVNRRVQANAIAGVVRISSHGHDLLQVCDVLTGAVVYPRRRPGTRSRNSRPSVKSRLSRLVLTTLSHRMTVEPFDPLWLPSWARDRK